ncbi:hypothetical protein B296_00011677 [Ensete ventricosum]|uniref:Uncharacterized protein n=1 Tax=Ensete ventricosum TaxID=4639 RepID=A0A426Z7B4_ENSVE|nr:hypothetical protein B296_00011677 [Ensete ventricosum]
MEGKEATCKFCTLKRSSGPTILLSGVGRRWIFPAVPLFVKHTFACHLAFRFFSPCGYLIVVDCVICAILSLNHSNYDFRKTIDFFSRNIFSICDGNTILERNLASF